MRRMYDHLTNFQQAKDHKDILDIEEGLWLFLYGPPEKFWSLELREKEKKEKWVTLRIASYRKMWNKHNFEVIVNKQATKSRNSYGFYRYDKACDNVPIFHL